MLILFLFDFQGSNITFFIISHSIVRHSFWKKSSIPCIIQQIIAILFQLYSSLAWIITIKESTSFKVIFSFICFSILPLLPCVFLFGVKWIDPYIISKHRTHCPWYFFCMYRCTQWLNVSQDLMWKALNVKMFGDCWALDNLFFLLLRTQWGIFKQVLKYSKNQIK